MVPTTEHTEAGQQTADAGATGAEPRILVAETRRVMAIEASVQIAALPAQEVAARSAVHAAMDFFEEVDARLSRFKPESELSRLNRVAGRWFDASELLFDCTEVAVAAAQATDGLFDPTLLHQIEALGYDRDFVEIAQREAPSEETLVAREIRAGGWRDVKLDTRRRRIRLPEGVGLDLGGIAKGWACDLAFAQFCMEFPGALLNLGGDLRLQGGPQPGQAWSVDIRDPRRELDVQASGSATLTATLTFSRGGLATSGAPFRWWLRSGERQHHLLDPRTGEPVRLWMAGADTLDAANTHDQGSLLATATALAPTATQAEVAAKVALLRGPHAALPCVERAWQPFEIESCLATGADAGDPSPFDRTVALLLISGDGTLSFSGNMHEYLATWGTEGAPVPFLVDRSLTSQPSSAPTFVFQ
jgi:thiamine biosynthesis lipoprotein